MIKKGMRFMTITEVSKKYGVTADTLRYYERIGLIPSINRTPGGIRNYTEQDCGWVEFIKCMRGAGVQVELNPGEELSYTDDGAMLITGIHQDRTGVCYAVATVYDFFLKVKDGPDISLRDLCGRNSLVTLNYEFFLY